MYSWKCSVNGHLTSVQKCDLADVEPEGHDSILLGAYVLVCENGQDHMRQIKSCKPDADMEPVIITQAHHCTYFAITRTPVDTILSKCASML